MELLITPLDQLPDPLAGDAWAADALAATCADLSIDDAPVAAWAGRRAGGRSGVLLTVWRWAEDAAGAATGGVVTLDGALVERGTVLTLQRAYRMPDAEAVPRVMQMVEFRGPRAPTAVAADAVSDRRISVAAADLPGLCGAIVATAPDGARLVATLATDEWAVPAMVEAMISSAPLICADWPPISQPDSIRTFDLVLCGTTPFPVAALDDRWSPSLAARG